MSDTPRSAPPRRASSPAWWLLTICAARVGANVVTLNYATAIPVLRPAWGMTAAQAGLIQSVFLMGYSLSLVGTSAAADRWGARRVFLASNLAGAACAVLFGALARDFLSAVLLYGLVGLVSGGGYTPGLMLVAARYEGSRRGRAMGLFLGAMSLGNAVSVACTGALLSALGWRLALLLTALGPITAALLAAVVVRDVPEPPRAPFPGLGGVRETLRNRAGMLVNWAYTFHAWELLGMWGWTPAFLAAWAARTEGGSGVALGANLTATMHLVGLVSSGVSGALSDRWGRTGVSLALLATSATSSFVFGWLLEHPLGLVLLVGALYSFTIIGDSAIYSTAITELTPPRILGTTLALRSLIGYTAGAVAPAAFGLVLDATNPPGAPPQTWGWAFASLGAGALPGLWALARLRALPESRAMAGGRR